MKAKVYISQVVEKNIGTRFKKVLKKNGYNVSCKIIENSSNNIAYVTPNASLKYIDATYNNLNTSDKYLSKFIKVVKRLYCLSKIDKTITYKEFRKYFSFLNKTFLYIQISSSNKNWQHKFNSVDKLLKHYINDTKYIELANALPETFNISDIILLFQEFTDTIWFENELKNQKTNTFIQGSNDKQVIKQNKKKSYILLEQFLNSKLNDSKKKHFEDLLALSLSLNKEEKIRVIRTLPTLSLFQIDELINVWVEESESFKKLEKIHSNEISKRKQKCDTDWEEIKKNLKRYLRVSPQEIYNQISLYIKGQNHVIKEFSTILYYQEEIMYGNNMLKPIGPILLAGPTGSGKSFLLQTSASLTNLPYIHVDCSSLVSEGIRGYGINDVLKDLLRICDYDINRAEKSIIFFDEFDKLLLHHDGKSIMTQILRIAEGHNTPIVTSIDQAYEFNNIKSLNTNNILFVFGGSFEHIIEEKKENHSGFLQQDNAKKELNLKDLESSGFPKELLGRIKSIFILNSLQEKDYFEILKKGKNSPLLEYENLIKVTHSNNVTINDDVLKSISKMAFKSNYGARGLHQIIYKLFQNILFEAPETKKIYDITLKQLNDIKTEMENEKNY